MFYLYDQNFEFAGTSAVKIENSTEVNPFDETGLTVTGNFFDPEKQVWYDKPQPVDTTQQTLGTLAKQVADLSVTKETSTKAEGALAKQVAQLSVQLSTTQQALGQIAVQLSKEETK